MQAWLAWWSYRHLAKYLMSFQIIINFSPFHDIKVETAISNLKSSILDATRQADKSEREIERLIKSTNSLRRQKSLEECRRDALATQMASMKEELKKIKAKSVNIPIASSNTNQSTFADVPLFPNSIKHKKKFH